MRHDGGDAETGFGADIGASLAWSDAKRGLSAELRGRGLLAHEAEGFWERGFSGAFSCNPVEGDRSPRLSVTQTAGGASSGGAAALLGPDTLEGLVADGSGDDIEGRRLDLRFGYGLGVPGGRWTATPELWLGLSDTVREQRFGWRLNERSPGGLAIDLEGTRHARADGMPAEHAVGATLGVQ